MRRLARIIVWVCVSAFALLITVSMAAWAQAWLVKMRASDLLRIAENVNVGQSSLSEVEKEAQPFSDYRGAIEKLENGDEYRSFIFDNDLLSKFWLSTYRRFTVRFVFHDGVLIEKSAEASVEGDCRIGVTERVASAAQAGLPKHFSTIPPDFDQPVAVASIIDEATYDQSLRKKDWGFDLNYLSSVRRCRDARKILPAVSR